MRRERLEAEPVTVVVGRLAPLLLRGLAETLADDHRVRVLASDIQNGALEDAVKESRPTVVILDDESIEHADLNRLKSQLPGLAVLVFTRLEPELYRTMLIAAGVTCLARDAAPGELTTAVHHAARELGRLRTTHRLEQALLRKAALLTDREREILKCIVEGHTHRKMARSLCITAETARSHSRRVRRKLEVQSNRELFGMTCLIGGFE